MRFFSNEARESTDDRDRAADDRDQPAAARDTTEETQPIAVPGHVPAESPTVPGQRPPSPWATPAGERRDEPAADPATGDAGGYADDPERTQPTGFGAVPVAAGTPVDARRDAVEEPAAVAAGTVDSPTATNTTTYAGGTAAAPAPEAVDVVDVPLDDHDHAGTPAGQDRDGIPAGQDRDGSAAGHRPEHRDDTAGRAPEGADGSTDGPALQDRGGFDDPRAVDPATEQPLDTGNRTGTEHHEVTTDAHTGEGKDDVADTDAAGTGITPPEPAAPEIAPVPVPAAAAPAPSGEKAFFDAEDAKGFQERWRDVQLRFVDSPKDAAGEAGTLVDEAVAKLTESLQARKNELAGEHDDTEALRVQLRGYRDILNRVLGL